MSRRTEGAIASAVVDLLVLRGAAVMAVPSIGACRVSAPRRGPPGRRLR
jgi:hypothetical protein